jgi:hypothetical protein
LFIDVWPVGNSQYQIRAGSICEPGLFLLQQNAGGMLDIADGFLHIAVNAPFDAFDLLSAIADGFACTFLQFADNALCRSRYLIFVHGAPSMMLGENHVGAGQTPAHLH